MYICISFLIHNKIETDIYSGAFLESSWPWFTQDYFSPLKNHIFFSIFFGFLCHFGTIQYIGYFNLLFSWSPFIGQQCFDDLKFEIKEHEYTFKFEMPKQI